LEVAAQPERKMLIKIVNIRLTGPVMTLPSYVVAA
jgi:hypothetical protein